MGDSRIACHGKRLKYTASIPQPPQKVWLTEKRTRWMVVSRVSAWQSRESLRPRWKNLASRHSRVEPIDITAIIDLPQVVKVPERQRIEAPYFGISLERQCENILDRF